jgi:hypothetical protein
VREPTLRLLLDRRLGGGDNSHIGRTLRTVVIIVFDPTGEHAADDGRAQRHCRQDIVGGGELPAVEALPNFTAELIDTFSFGTKARPCGL